MGTLTANSTRLPEYCEHKLPASCRLSSIPNCCACADERAHAASYSTYIDGVGFVLRGTRWQRYCWFCKEFWEQRVRISGLRPGQTKIPEVPDQTDFLKKWYEFHQGYRIVIKEDGSEERVAVLGEEFKDVSPGCLPRTLEELRTGGRREEEVHEVQNSVVRMQQEHGPSIEDTLEQMFAAVSLESNEQIGQSSISSTNAQQPPPSPAQEPTRSSNIHAQAMNPASSRGREYQMRRVTALRRELDRMRNGIVRVITGLRELGQEVPNHSETTEQLMTLGNTIIDTIAGAPSEEDAERAINSVNRLASSIAPQTETDRTMAGIQARLDDARSNMDEARRARDQAESEMDLAEEEFRTSQHRFHQIQREQRTTENYMRIFGTREEVIAQGENYVSPIGGMFSRAEERFRAAEEVRREQRTLRQVLEDEASSGGEESIRRLTELERRQREMWGVPQPGSRTAMQAAARISAEQTVEITDDELFASPAYSRSNRPPREDGIETPPTLAATGEESALGEYYAMLRRQDQNRAGLHQVVAPAGNAVNSHDVDRFPHSFLDVTDPAWNSEVVERGNLFERPHLLSFRAESLDGDDVIPNAILPPDFSPEAWRHQDANHINRALASDEELRIAVHSALASDEVLRTAMTAIGVTYQDASALLVDFMITDTLSEHDRMVIDSLMRNNTVIWRTGLPAEWIRRRQDGPYYPQWEFFTGGEGFPGAVDWAGHHNRYMGIELVAQAYQMSANIRQFARRLTPPQRLQMLYRLQAGLRMQNDVEMLEEMYNDVEIFGYARSRYMERLRLPPDTALDSRAYDADNARREMARNGNHSREELENRRRDTTHAFALAAGRQAMQEGSDALFARLQDQEEGARAAYRRIEGLGSADLPAATIRYRQASLFDYLHAETDSESDSDSDKAEQEPEARGLDAPDTGRPEPKADEELQVELECKICYTQISEIACLPCGHLVMCRWCSEQHSPCHAQDRTRPRRAAACPVCRKGIRQKVRVFRA